MPAPEGPPSSSASTDLELRFPHSKSKTPTIVKKFSRINYDAPPPRRLTKEQVLSALKRLDDANETDKLLFPALMITTSSSSITSLLVSVTSLLEDRYVHSAVPDLGQFFRLVLKDVALRNSLWPIPYEHTELLNFTIIPDSVPTSTAHFQPDAYHSPTMTIAFETSEHCNVIIHHGLHKVTSHFLSVRELLAFICSYQNAFSHSPLSVPFTSSETVTAKHITVFLRLFEELVNPTSPEDVRMPSLSILNLTDCVTTDPSRPCPDFLLFSVLKSCIHSWSSSLLVALPPLNMHSKLSEPSTLIKIRSLIMSADHDSDFTVRYQLVYSAYIRINDVTSRLEQMSAYSPVHSRFQPAPTTLQSAAASTMLSLPPELLTNVLVQDAISAFATCDYDHDLCVCGIPSQSTHAFPPSHQMFRIHHSLLSMKLHRFTSLNDTVVYELQFAVSFRPHTYHVPTDVDMNVSLASPAYKPVIVSASHLCLSSVISLDSKLSDVSTLIPQAPPDCSMLSSTVPHSSTSCDEHHCLSDANHMHASRTRL